MKVLYFSRDYTPHDHRFLSVLAESEHEIYFDFRMRRHSRDPGLQLTPGTAQLGVDPRGSGGADVPQLLRVMPWRRCQR